ncbi:Cytochrome P450 77A3-like protein [Drosera capensis]
MDSSPSTFLSYFHLFFISFALLISTFLVSHGKKQKRVLKLPPGPPGWPVVGNLFQMGNRSEYVRDLMPIYGPIFTLKFGTRTKIVVCSAELTHKALIKKGQAFSSRVWDFPTRAIFSCNKFTVNNGLYGPVWRSLRRNMVQNMLSSSRLKDFKGVRDAAMDKLIQRIMAEAEINGGLVWVMRHARFALFSILLSLCIGLEIDNDVIEKMEQMLKKVLIVSDPKIDDFLPILSPFSKRRREALQVRKQQVELFEPYIENRRAIIRDRISRIAEPLSGTLDLIHRHPHLLTWTLCLT